MGGNTAWEACLVNEILHERIYRLQCKSSLLTGDRIVVARVAHSILHYIWCAGQQYVGCSLPVARHFKLECKVVREQLPLVLLM